MTEPLLSAAALGIRYGATVALDDVDLDLHRGEVHAVVGENGAGKSTLLRVLAGAERAASGQVRRAAGVRVEWVPQEPMLPPDLDAAAWIFLGRELRGRSRLLRAATMRAAAADALTGLGCSARPGARLGTLAASQRKQVQLARAVRTHPDVLLLDEPTALLGAAETATLFAAIRAAVRAGAGVLYVSHRIAEVLGLADRVTVLRDGRRITTRAAGELAVSDLVRAMVGRDVPEAPRAVRERGEVVLCVADLDVGPVRAATFAVRAGEIVGLAGLVGSGRSAVLEAIAGHRPVTGGTIDVRAAPRLVPEDRQHKGLVATHCVRENLLLPAPELWLRRRSERRVTKTWIDRLAIRTAGTEAPIQTLSGGNQQKLLLARALRHRPRLLLLDEPTAGVDVGAKAEIHALIRRLADDGTAVLLASSELTELLALCDRIAVLAGGACAAVVDVDDASEERLAALMTA